MTNTLKTLHRNVQNFRHAAWILVALIGSFPSTNAHAATFCVHNYAELAAAVTAAGGNGEEDDIRLTQGTYAGGGIQKTSLEQKTIRILGGFDGSCTTRTVDANNTVLWTTSAGPFLYLNSAAPTGVLFELDGVTIKKAPSPGGQNELLKLIRASRAIITNSIFTGSTARSAITITGADLNGVISIRQNSFRNNVNLGVGGGGLHLNGNAFAVDISGNTFLQNTTATSGGGLSFGVQTSSGRASTITDNIFQSNHAQTGGGLQINTAVTDAARNTFEDNFADLLGGAVSAVPTGIVDLLVEDSTFLRNRASKGGAIYLQGWSHGTLRNNVVAGNTAATGFGGGLYANNVSRLTLVNNTITANQATTTRGGGVYVELKDLATAELYNNLLWSNTAPAAGSGADLGIDNDVDKNGIVASATVLNNDLDQSIFGLWVKVGVSLDQSNLNAVDPGFVNPGSYDYHLSNSSLVIGRGLNTAPGISPIDRDGNPRIQGTDVDLGAYEFSI